MTVLDSGELEFVYMCEQVHNGEAWVFVDMKTYAWAIAHGWNGQFWNGNGRPSMFAVNEQQAAMGMYWRYDN